ncbi:hypothetical protein J2X45_003915 [Caulobacter sp. BE264]|uniref:hypothetical protein n=1 Tax=Caulobacter sp. BE264 TaxID=2817724 RepID=UPI002856A2E2|nr:hypothetical protein [Caulobacter sp. BE264]MDR7232805.1 hypothetical protein [Caulobacter sp. BE264]
MSELLDDLAEQAIGQALGGGPRKAVLCSVLRTAGRMLAESEGHGFAAQVHAQEVVRHEQKRTRLGTQGGRNRR